MSSKDQSTPRVRILDDVVINQIAAGEVVERPASVVKELVENSIDAGSTQITVAIGNGGKSSIEVLDNGCGMSRADALLAIERFGTSKITAVDDLQRIQTLGFRGEALPSIASVSRFVLESRAADKDETGVQINIQGGVLRDVVDKQVPVGTRIRVNSLFFNVPARRKFLRSETTEAGFIKAIVADFALAYPAIRLGLVVDGKEAAQYPAVADFAARIEQLQIAGTAPILLNHTLETEGVRIGVGGAISRPLEAVSGSGKLRVLVNGRAVRDGLLLKALREGYGNFLKPGKYPKGVLSIELPADEVDVNVHPQKTEVRFRSPSDVFRAVAQAAHRALIDVPHDEDVPAASMEYTGSMNYTGQAVANAENVSWTGEHTPTFLTRTAEFFARPGQDFSRSKAVQSAVVFSAADAAVSTQTVRAAGKSPGQFPEVDYLRYLGQIMNLYLLFEGAGKLVMVDMHAAHERVRFYQLKKQFLAGEIKSQLLLIPETIRLEPDQLGAVEEGTEALQKLGIECERFEEDCIVVRALPALLGGVSAKALLNDLLSLNEFENWELALERRLDEVLARLSCHSSVRSGRQMEREEAYALLNTLKEVEASAFCPHGRPTLIALAEAELEQMFGRIV